VLRLRGLLGGLLFPLGADDAARYAELIDQHQVETVAVLVRPDGTDFPLDGFAVAAFFRLAHDIGDVGWLVHNVSPSS
jgi:hypothetical protein